MAFWPLTQETAVNIRHSALATSSHGVTITSGAINTYGSWTDLIVADATTRPGTLLCIGARGTAVSAADSSTVIDIGVGGTGNAVDYTLASGLQCGYRDTQSPAQFYLPLRIPAGLRVACRAASIVASKAPTVNASLICGAGINGFPGYTTCTTYGFTATGSKGITIPGNATVNTEGAWTQIIASTTDAIDAVMLSIGGVGGVMGAGNRMLFDVGYGAAASEVSVLDDLWEVRQYAAEVIDVTPVDGLVIPLPGTIPAGSRLVVRGMGSVASAVDFHVTVHGFRK